MHEGVTSCHGVVAAVAVVAIVGCCCCCCCCCCWHRGIEELLLVSSELSELSIDKIDDDIKNRVEKFVDSIIKHTEKLRG